MSKIAFEEKCVVRRPVVLAHSGKSWSGPSLRARGRNDGEYSLAKAYEEGRPPPAGPELNVVTVRQKVGTLISACEGRIRDIVGGVAKEVVTYDVAGTKFKEEDVHLSSKELIGR